MSYTLLGPHLKSVADFANKIIKERYNIRKNGTIESSIDSSIPFRPTLHWQSKTHYIACEVADRPFPRSLKETFADILSSGLPIRLIVAFPKDVTLSLKDYQDDINQCKKFGIGYLPIDTLGFGTIEYKGVSLALYLPFPKDFTMYKPQIKNIVVDAYEHYLLKGDPEVGLQSIGQAVENILYNTAVQAKTKGVFILRDFNPPNFIRQAVLINAMITQNVLDSGILGRCKDFAKDRNSVVIYPKTLMKRKK